MQKRCGVIALFLLLTFMLQAQQKITFPEADHQSYKLYVEGNWKELIQYSEQVRKQEIDFFYLQARTGIAYYNLKKYRTASRWFLKAWENDKSFEWLQEYLYYSLLYGGRTYEANKIAGEFSPAMKEKIGYTAVKLNGADLETGYSFNPGIKELKTAPHGQKAGTGDGYGEAFYLKGYHFESVDISHRIAPAININHNLTHIRASRVQRIDWGNTTFFEAGTTQFQYFINPCVVVGKKWYLSSSLNGIWGDFSYARGGFRGNNRIYSDEIYKYRDLVFTASTWTHFGSFSPGAEFNYGNINNEGFSQYSLWLTFYPLGNLNFYFTPRFYFRSDSDSRFTFNTLGLSGGLQTGPVHFYLQYLNGEMEYFIESAGYIVSNFPGKTEHKFSGSVYFPTGKKYRFVLRYIWQDMSERYQVYQNMMQSNSLTYKYYKHTITTGISWSF